MPDEADGAGPDTAPWRLFVAIDVPDEVRLEIDRRTAALRTAPGARWVAVQNLHLTLAFLGGRPPGAVAGIVTAVEAVARDGAPYFVRLGGVGSFGGGRRGRVLWLGLQGGREETAALALELQARLQTSEERAAAEQGGERRPTPHLTLAREADTATVSAARGALASSALTWRVDRLSLYRSHLGRGAPVYEEVASAPLGGDAGGLRSGPCSGRLRELRGC